MHGEKTGLGRSKTCRKRNIEEVWVGATDGKRYVSKWHQRDVEEEL